MSFVNLLSNDRWTDADITRRTEAMVHSVVPAIEENVLMRKSMAAAQGQWTLTADEMALIGAYSQACMTAHQAGIDARADWAKLEAVLALESSIERLTLPMVTEPLTVIVDEVEVPNPAIEIDAQERAAAQITVDNASNETLALFTLRHPPEPEPLPEPTPEPV